MPPTLLKSTGLVDDVTEYGVPLPFSNKKEKSPSSIADGDWAIYC